MSDTVALSLIALLGVTINLAVSIATNRKVSACGSKECVKAIEVAK